MVDNILFNSNAVVYLNNKLKPKTMYKPNGSKEDIKIGILHSIDGYYVSNEGTKINPNYHVWVPGITHATCDSAYSDISIAVARCNYIAKNKY